MKEFIYFLIGMILCFCYDFVKTYLIKRAENKATIRDLSEMTKIAEEIKQGFQQDLSRINAQLTVLTNQSSLVDEKSIEVLNNFFERCLIIKDLHSQNLGDFVGKDLAQRLLDYQIEVEKSHRKLYSDYHKLVLFHIKNKEIIKNANEIAEYNYLIKSTFMKHFGKIKMAILQEMTININNISEYKIATEKTQMIIDEYYDDQKSNLSSFYNSFNKFLISLNQYLSKYGLNYDYAGLKE